MRFPILGSMRCAEGYGCSRCGNHDEPNVFATFGHDLRYWGWRTALHNLRIRLMPPAWLAG